MSITEAVEYAYTMPRPNSVSEESKQRLRSLTEKDRRTLGLCFSWIHILELQNTQEVRVDKKSADFSYWRQVMEEVLRWLGIH